MWDDGYHISSSLSWTCRFPYTVLRAVAHTYKHWHWQFVFQSPSKCACGGQFILFKNVVGIPTVSISTQYSPSPFTLMLLDARLINSYYFWTCTTIKPFDVTTLSRGDGYRPICGQVYIKGPKSGPGCLNLVRPQRQLYLVVNYYSNIQWVYSWFF